jgi:UPF0271 protein
MTGIDLNCDMGELHELHEDGTQARLMRYVSSVNIACGAHAGDERLMAETVRDALNAGVAIGAHPGYPDRVNFGRIPLAMSAEDLRASILQQLRTLGKIVAFTYVKPHGALYNVAVHDRKVARTIALAVADWSHEARLVGLAGSAMLEEFAACGFRVIAEGFADRRYEPDGTLRSRKLTGALLTDPQEAAAQALSIARDGLVIASDGCRLPLRAETICLHSDTPGSTETAARIHQVLVSAGLVVRRIPGL